MRKSIAFCAGGAVIAAGSVVRTSIPAGMVAAGVPAKVIKAVSGTYAAITAPSFSNK